MTLMFRLAIQQHDPLVPARAFWTRLVRCHSRWSALCFFLVFLALMPAPAWGHAERASAALSAQDLQWGGLPVLLCLVAVLGLGVGMWRYRTAAAWCVVCCIGLFAFETAVHSVHHLSDTQQGADCQVFTVSQQVTGVPAEPCALWTPTLGQVCAPSNTAEAIPSYFFHPTQERAPPLRLA
jgi:hypothetical protein